METETLGDTRGDAEKLVQMVADLLAEMEAEALGGTLSDAHALVESVADTLAEVAP